ncbi:hypothetical protein S245_000896 [Arachis hypogaea]
MTNVSQFPTAKALWEGLATTYGSGTDPVQIYDLHRKANTQKQGQDTLEEFWINYRLYGWLLTENNLIL